MNPERTERFSVTVDEDVGLLGGKDELYEALSSLQDFRQSGTLNDLHNAQLAVMRAYCLIDDEIKQTPEVR